MRKIEIKYDRKKTWTVIAYLAIGVVGSSYFVYLTDTFKDNETLRIIMLPLNAFMLLYAARLGIKLLDKEAVLTLTSDEIEFQDESRQTRIKWSEIYDVKIEEDKHDGRVALTIVTGNSKKTIDITGLEREPDEITKLIDAIRSK